MTHPGSISRNGTAMLKHAAALLALLVFFTTATAQTTQPWIRWAPEGSGFALMLPGKPEGEIIKKDQFSGSLYTLVAKDGTTPRAIYLVGWGEYAPSVKFETQAELEANRDNFVKAVPGMRLLGTQKITLDGRPGIEFTGDSERASLVSRVYVVGNRVYQLAVMVFKGIDETTNVNKFFDSFAILTNK
jgi:hypothetical protein